MLAAPASGSGKTVLTLALLRALKARGMDVRAGKAGPDYIDPAFHAAACGAPSVNLDPWAMNDDRLKALAAGQGGELLVVEAMMGLFDAAADGTGSPADLAATLGIPVVLVIDCARQSHSVAALAKGFRDHRQEVQVAGVILNRVGSARHEKMLRAALLDAGIAVLGAMPRHPGLELPDRHLGLVQAGEHGDLERFIGEASALAEKHLDLDAIAGLATPLTPAMPMHRLPPLGQRIAIARDLAFSFVYPHWLADWQAQGSELSFFSPLGDEGPAFGCDAVFLPGGYPELHAGVLAAAVVFKAGMRAAAARGVLIYGECGGYMALGDVLVDAQGNRHAMCGLLRLETSFAKRKLSLGYRRIEAIDQFALGQRLTGHEFHYSTILRQEGTPLFTARDAEEVVQGHQGLREGNVMGSYLHVIDGAP